MKNALGRALFYAREDVQKNMAIKRQAKRIIDKILAKYKNAPEVDSEYIYNEVEEALNSVLCIVSKRHKI